MACSGGWSVTFRAQPRAPFLLFLRDDDMPENRYKRRTFQYRDSPYDELLAFAVAQLPNVDSVDDIDSVVAEGGAAAATLGSCDVDAERSAAPSPTITRRSCRPGLSPVLLSLKPRRTLYWPRNRNLATLTLASIKMERSRDRRATKITSSWTRQHSRRRCAEARLPP